MTQSTAPDHYRDVSGFTLIESLLALSVLALVLAAIVSLQLTSVAVTADSREASDATEIVSQMLLTLEGAVYESDGAGGFVISDYLGCPSVTTVTCSATGGLPDADVFPALTAARYPQLDRYAYAYDIVGVQQESGSFLDEGLVRITVGLQGPSNVTLASFATCYDASRTPTVEIYEPCPVPTN